MKQRYFVTEPVPGGYAWFDVRDRFSEIMPNFPLASFSKHLPMAPEEAYRLCGELNKGDKR